jgi:phosphoglycerate dehydrogenase-like enzyme
LVELDDLLGQADYVTLHAPSNPATRQILNERTLGLMKPSAWVFNTARGDLIDEAALYRVLSEKKIAGAGLDTFEVEPTPPDNPILKLDNVIVTPHAAGFSDEAVRSGQRMGAREMAAILAGRFPPNISGTDTVPVHELIEGRRGGAPRGAPHDATRSSAAPADPSARIFVSASGGTGRE